MRVPEYRLDDAVIAFLNDELFSAERCQDILRVVLSETGGLREKTTEKRRELEGTKREVERLIQRWEAAFETDSQLRDTTDRYRELVLKKRELDRSIDQLRDLRQPPLELSRPDVIHRFQQLLKDALRSPDRRLAKGYLRLLVDRVVVHPVVDREAEIEVITKGTGAVALMATSRSSVTPVLTAEGAVHAAVGDWLPSCATSKNYTATVVIDLQAARKRLRPRSAPLPRVTAAARASEWLRQLETGEVESRAEIARREGLSRARVTQIMSTARCPRRDAGCGSK